MKIKKKAVIAATVFAAAMNFSACDNYGYNVYGPPPEEWEYEETNTENVSNDDTTQTEEETSYGSGDNINEDSYDSPEEEYEDTSQTEEETSYDPADNINEDVYGPPIDE